MKFRKEGLFFILGLCVLGFARSACAQQATVQPDLDSFAYVFVTGYFGESIPGYFDVNADEFQKQGAKFVSKIVPPSTNPVVQNLEQVRTELHQAFNRAQGDHHRPLIVFAHSKGGLEVLNVLLRFASEFPPEVIEKVMLIQTPVQGCIYADAQIAQWQSSGKVWDPNHWQDASRYAGMISISRSQVAFDLGVSANFSTSQERRSLSSRLWYWRSQKARDSVSEFLKDSAALIQAFGENDGAIRTVDERLPELLEVFPFGHDLGVHRGLDHLDVVALGPTPNSQRESLIRQTSDEWVHWSILPRPVPPPLESTLESQFRRTY